MVGLLLTLSAWGMDCSLDAPLSQAEDSILSLDLEGGADALEEAKAKFGCGNTSPDDLARYWLLIAAHAEFSGQTGRVDDALQAARITSTSHYIEGLGPDLKARWEASVPASGSASVLLTDLPDGYTFLVDGKDNPNGQLTPGFHVVQAHGGDHGFGRVVRASAGDDLQLSTSLPELAVAIVPVVAPEEPDEDLKPEPVSGKRIAFHVGVGVTSAFGVSFDEEPAAKIGPSLEVGVVLRPNASWWLRGALHGDLLLGGAWTYSQEGEVKSLPIAPTLTIAAGLSVAALDLGVQLGQQLPGRFPVRVVASYAVLTKLRVEARGGINARRTQSGAVDVEGAGSLHVTLGL